LGRGYRNSQGELLDDLAEAIVSANIRKIAFVVVANGDGAALAGSRKLPGFDLDRHHERYSVRNQKSMSSAEFLGWRLIVRSGRLPEGIEKMSL